MNLVFAVTERVFGHPPLVRGAVAPLALINAAGVVAHDEHIHVFQKLRRNFPGPRQFRRRLNGDEFAEQIKTSPQIINVASAARAVENRAAAMKNIGAKIHRVLRQPLATFFDGVLPNQSTETNLKFES